MVPTSYIPPGSRKPRWNVFFFFSKIRLYNPSICRFRREESRETVSITQAVIQLVTVDLDKYFVHNDINTFHALVQQDQINVLFEKSSNTLHRASTQ